MVAFRRYAFKTDAALCLIIDLMMGGDLSFHLARAEAQRLSEPAARYYMARVLLGLEVMHEAKIVYRDLKPENVLVDGDGRTRLSDLGLAVPLKPDMKGTAGTPGYLAPEMLQGKGYSEKVDWWSYGCMLYELVNGKGPFRTEEADKFGGETDLQKAVNRATCEMDVAWPEHFSADLKDLCGKILNRDPAARFGAAEIAAHPWFSALDWDVMRADPEPDDLGKEAAEHPPIVPGKKLNIEDASDIGEFPDLPDVTIVPEDFPEDEWLYVSEKYFQSEVVWLLQFRASQAKTAPPPSSGACAIL